MQTTTTTAHHDWAALRQLDALGLLAAFGDALDRAPGLTRDQAQAVKQARTTGHKLCTKLAGAGYALNLQALECALDVAGLTWVGTGPELVSEGDGLAYRRAIVQALRSYANRRFEQYRSGARLVARQALKGALIAAEAPAKARETQEKAAHIDAEGPADLLKRWKAHGRKLAQMMDEGADRASLAAAARSVAALQAEADALGVQLPED